MISGNCHEFEKKLDEFVVADAMNTSASDILLANFIVQSDGELLDSVSDSNNTSVPISSSPDCNLEKCGQDSSLGSCETSHTQPDWLANLKRDFDSQIIQMCSAKTKSAVEANKSIEARIVF